MRNVVLTGLMFVCAASTSALYAQSGAAITARKASSEEQQASAFLPANTEVNLRLNEEINTKQNEQGDTIILSVTHDVMLGDYVVIPQGSRAVGEITWMTGKGMFGKSGKFDLELRYVEVDGQRIPLAGKFRQEGNGNTVATVGAVVLVPVAGFLVTGKSGSMPRGKELTVYTAEPVPVMLAE